MTTTQTPVAGAPSRTAGARGTRPLAWAVLVAAVLEVAAPVVTALGPGASAGEGAGPELLITPVGWAFSIWGVIYTLAIVQAVAVLVKGAETVPRLLQLGQVVLYLGGTVWIVMAAIESSLATAIALAVMLAGAVVAVLAATRGPVDGPSWLGTLTRAAVGLFAGWVSAAFFLNVSTALAESGALDAGEAGWQLVVLAVALLTLLVLLRATRGNPAYAAAGTWAFVGIAVTGAQSGPDSVLIAGVVGAVVVVGAAIALRITGRRAELLN